jgi:hypothetical protein
MGCPANSTFTAFAIGIALALGGCAEKGHGDKAAPGVSKSAEDGAVSLKLTLAPAELPFDGKAVLTVEAVAPRGVTVEVSDYQERIREAGRQYEFRATRTQRNEAVLSADGKLRWEYVYGLEFFVPGEFELPAAKMSYAAPAAGAATDLTHQGDGLSGKEAGQSAATADAAGASEAEAPKRLETESIHVKALATDEATQAATKLTEIKTLPPKELAEPWTRWVIVSAVAASVATLAILLIARRMRRQSQEPVIVLAAHEWFDRQLAALLGDDLIPKGLIQEFHYRISDILRGYIERRFHVHAREMTTEEFLAAAGRDNRFGAVAAADLNNFLTACDMVKYARHTPGPQQADALVRTAGEFVNRTRERVHRPGDESSLGTTEHAA